MAENLNLISLDELKSAVDMPGVKFEVLMRGKDIAPTLQLKPPALGAGESSPAIAVSQVQELIDSGAIKLREGTGFVARDANKLVEKYGLHRAYNT